MFREQSSSNRSSKQKSGLKGSCCHLENGRYVWTGVIWCCFVLLEIVCRYDLWLFSEVMHLRYFDENIDLIASFMPIGSLALLNDRCEKIFAFLRKLQLVVILY